MANLWEKVKETLDQGAKTVKESAESVAKTVAEKAPQIASTLKERGMELADNIGDKAQEMKTVGQLKIKYFNLNKDVSNQFNEIGGKVYDLMKNNKKNIYADPDIIKMIGNVKNLEAQIKEVEKRMEEAKKPKPDEGEKTTEQAEQA